MSADRQSYLKRAYKGGVVLKLELTRRQFRLLLDMVYIGNWVLNSARGADRITEYDEIESKIFLESLKNGLPELAEIVGNEVLPSRAFVDGGIHEAIMDYEDAVFFDILAEELARRDMQAEGIAPNDGEELGQRIKEYVNEFEINGVENISIDIN